MRTAAHSALPYLTSDLPGVGGVIKQHDEDFRVEEIPLYEPGGTGTHVYFAIEKTGLTTWQATRKIAGALGRQPREFGYAGMKDARAVTRQVLSIEHLDPAAVEALEVPGVRVLWTNRHTNKLKIGHLKGNRFTVKIRQAEVDSTERIEAILDVLTRRGAPNYFGEQRFGATGDNAAVGRAVVIGRLDEAIALICGRPSPSEQGDALQARQRFDAGDYLAAADAWSQTDRQRQRLCVSMHKACGAASRAWRAVDRKLEQLYVSAFQSELFNRVVADRVELLDRLQDGDLAWKHANGAVFVVEDASAEQPRCDAFEISPTGPLFGRKVRWPDGAPGRAETAVLSEAGLSPETLAAVKHRDFAGARRPLRFQPRDCLVDTGADERGPYLDVAFSLDAGSYATTLIREVCKSAPMS